MDRGDGFKGRQFTAEVILWAVRWYLMFPISYRDLELMLLDRGVEVDHTTIFRWIQAYAEELEKRIRPHLRMSNGSWRVDETYVRVKGRWTYLYRAVDSRGQTIDFLSGCTARYGCGEAVLSQGARAAAHRQSAHAHRRQEPRLSKSGRGDEKRRSNYGAASRLRQCKYLNNIVEQDHRRIKRLVRPGLGFGSFRYRATNIGGFRNDGDDQEGTDSKDRRS